MIDLNAFIALINLIKFLSEIEPEVKESSPNLIGTLISEFF